MCGILGYTGHNQASEILLDGLAKLEYRGYDSAGLAVLDKGEISKKESEPAMKSQEPAESATHAGQLTANLQTLTLTLCGAMIRTL